MDTPELSPLVRMRDLPRQRRFQFAAPEGIEDQSVFAELAVDGVLAFAGDFCTPLSVELWSTCCDSYTTYPVSDPVPDVPFWHRHQRVTPLHARARPAWRDERVSEVDLLDRTAILDLIRTALDQRCGSGDTEAVIGWREMTFGATAVRLPDGLIPARSSTVPVSAGAGRIDYPIERRDRALWVAGPLPGRTLDPPLVLSVKNEAGLLTLVVSAFWSAWDDGTPGGAYIGAASERLLDLGWTLTS